MIIIWAHEVLMKKEEALLRWTLSSYEQEHEVINYPPHEVV